MPARLRRESGPVCDLRRLTGQGTAAFEKKFKVLMRVKASTCPTCEQVIGWNAAHLPPN
jgi:hypothetical protein